MNPKVFKVTFVDDCHHREATCGGMDSEFSHTTRECYENLVIAPDMETAQFLWNHQRRAITTMSGIVWIELGPVSMMMTDKPVLNVY